jgi:MFS family permease
MNPARHREFPPYVSYLIVVLMSVALLTLQTTVPFQVKELGGGLDIVGFLFTWTSLWYVVAGLSLGWISQRYGPRRTMLVTLMICVLSTLGIPWTRTVWQLGGLMTVYFVTICVFWAAAEHASTGLHRRLTVVQSTAIFCVSFSTGNGIGMLASAVLQQASLSIPFFVSGGLTLVVAGLTWLTVSPQAGFHHSTAADVAAFTESDRQRLRRSLLAARIGMVGTYGAYAVVTLFLPRYLWEFRAYSKPVAGGLTALVLAGMATSFAWHGWYRHWPHKLWPVRTAPFAAAGALVLLGMSAHPLLFALAGMAIGALAATAYMHNLYYALEEPGLRAKRAGVHEALVGLAFLVPPALSGLATRWVRDPRGVFWAAAGLALLVGVTEHVALARRAAPQSAPR